MAFRQLPIYEALINREEDGIIAISLVDYPAVESDFVCFKDNSRTPVRFAIESDEERLISGVVMLAQTPIYRRDPDGYEYYIMYSKDTIKKMAEKMLKDNTFNRIDLQHDGNMVSGVSLVEVYIKNSAKGISPSFVEDVPDGSLMASFHIEDDTLWDEVKNGNMLNGFSLEGFFSIKEITDKYNSTMNIFKKMANSLMKFGEIDTDKGKIFWEGEELVINANVYVENEDGEKIAAEDGEYKIEGKTIVVAEGKVTEIREDEVEEVVEVDAAKAKFNKVKVAFEESYEEKERKIIEAIRSLGFADSYLIEAGDDYAVVEIWNDETASYRDVRFSISWDENGEVVVGEFEEVKPAFVPVDEEPVVEPAVEQFEEVTEEPQPEVRDDKDEKIESLEQEISDLKVEIENIKNQLADLVIKPVAEPIAEEFENALVKKNNIGLSKKTQKTINLFSHR